MHDDPWAIAKAFVEYVRSTYPDDVALVAAYGSHVSGTPHDRSDLDLYFVPVTDRGTDASLRFILNGIGYDFWPLGWERLERIVRLDELAMIAALVDSMVLYTRARPDSLRFAALQARMRDQLHSGDLPVRLHRFDQVLKSVTAQLGNLLGPDHAASPSTSLMESNALVAELVAGLAFLNGQYLPRSWVQFLPQVKTFRYQPDGLAACLARYLQADSASEIRETCRELVEMCWRFREFFRTPVPGGYPDHFTGFYEEIKSSFNKVLYACETGDDALARVVAARLQREIAWHLARVEEHFVAGDATPVSYIRAAYDRAELPDITAIALDGDLSRLAAATRELDERFSALLSDQGVEFTRFASLDELQHYLQPEDSDSEDSPELPESDR
jgi:predicted nucleotidyltransferase